MSGVSPESFKEIFAGIGQEAVGRDHRQADIHGTVQSLLASGVGRFRVPVESGGLGFSLRESFGLLRDLAAADSNIPQIIRAHFAFVEGLRQKGETAGHWLDIVNNNVLFGAAMAERGPETSVTTNVTSTPEGLRLNGRKYYSTGTLYADWIIVWAAEGEGRVRLVVPSDAEGVTRIDDWDGFGQRLTGSGTTVFENVHVKPEWVLDRFKADELPAHPYLATYYQHFHLVTLAGIAQAVLRDAVAFVQPRTRAFGTPGRVIQREDPVVQGIIGRLSALAFSTRTLADHISDELAKAEPAWEASDLDNPIFEQVQEEAFQAQQIIIEQTLEAATLLFDVGGASATSETLGLDRHWRNARVLASHNPSPQRLRELGDLALNGTRLWTPYRKRLSGL